MALTIGTKAPDFKTTDQDGNAVKLSDFKGKESSAVLLSKRSNTWLYG
jgi:peroxiredoxin